MKGETDNRSADFLHNLYGSVSLCLDHPNIIHWDTIALMALTIWGTIYSFTGTNFLPGSQLISSLSLFVLSYVGGAIVQLIKLQSVLGMLLVGVLLRKIGFIQLSGVYMEITTTLREIALCIVLIRAGMGLDPKALKSLRFVILRLAFVPGIVEGIITTMVGHFLLEVPYLWGMLLGAILAAVTPPVVMPCLFSLQEATNTGEILFNNFI